MTDGRKQQQQLLVSSSCSSLTVDSNLTDRLPSSPFSFFSTIPCSICYLILLLSTLNYDEVELESGISFLPLQILKRRRFFSFSFSLLTQCMIQVLSPLSSPFRLVVQLLLFPLSLSNLPQRRNRMGKTSSAMMIIMKDSLFSSFILPLKDSFLIADFPALSLTVSKDW